MAKNPDSEHVVLSGTRRLTLSGNPFSNESLEKFAAAAKISGQKKSASLAKKQLQTEVLGKLKRALSAAEAKVFAGFVMEVVFFTYLVLIYYIIYFSKKRPASKWRFHAKQMLTGKRMC